MRTVARTEPAAKITCFTNGDTTQMRADTDHDEPFWLLDTFGIGLGISQGLNSAELLAGCYVNTYAGILLT